jgi:aminodeoxyfutalosine synthase
MSGVIDGARLRDPRLQPIAEKVTRGERLTPAEGAALYATTDLLGLGMLADFANRRKNGDRVFFSANQHINPTNVCVLRNTCVFCSFARMPKEDGAYTRSLEEVFHEAEQARGMPTREFHIVGGLHPKLRLSYYTDMIRGLRERHPQVHIKALTAVEIAHLARIERTSEREVLLAMKEAGLTSLPGGGAEVFSTAVRATIAERKLTGEEWIRVHRTAHQLGIPTNCTMLYGHIESVEDRVDHLLRLRALQDETGGFVTYIPLAFQPWEAPGMDCPETTGFADLKAIAVGRLLLDNVPHMKSYWIMIGPRLAQVGLSFGADDIDGTVTEEKIAHDAGAPTAQSMTVHDLCRLIREAGRRPVERDTVFNVVREW